MASPLPLIYQGIMGTSWTLLKSSVLRLGGLGH